MSHPAPREMPTLRQLRYFAVLAETGQYGRAAERLGISQPSLSQQIAALEGLLSLRLVERRRSGLVLTPGGREVLAGAQRALAEVEALIQVAQTQGDGLAGTLRLGSTPTIGPYFLPRLVQHLHAAFPDLKLIVRDGAPRALLEDLRSGGHDLILCHLPVSGADLRVQRLYREPLHLVVARDHPLTRQELVQRADLAEADVLTLGPAYALHGQVAGLCREVGARLREDYEGTSLDALRQMVAMNMGVTLLPALYVRSEITHGAGDVAVLKMRGGLYRSVGLVTRAGTAKSRLLGRFEQAAVDVIRDGFSGLISPER